MLLVRCRVSARAHLKMCLQPFQKNKDLLEIAFGSSVRHLLKPRNLTILS